MIRALSQVIPFKAPVPVKPIKPVEQPVQGMKSNAHSDRNPRRANYVRNNAPGNVVGLHILLLPDQSYYLHNFLLVSC